MVEIPKRLDKLTKKELIVLINELRAAASEAVEPEAEAGPEKIEPK